MARCGHSDCRRWWPDLALRIVPRGFHVGGDWTARQPDEGSWDSPGGVSEWLPSGPGRATRAKGTEEPAGREPRDPRRVVGWFCSTKCIASAAASRFRQRGQQPAASVTPVLAPVPALRLGVLLLHQGAITSASLTKALKTQKDSGLRLGAQLLQLGLATQEAILRGLSAQAGISYLTSIDASRVRQAPGGLSTDEIRALGIVPFGTVEAGHQMMVACQAPVPRAALSALRQLTGWNPEPFLVSDADFAALLQGYGIAAPTPRRVQQLVKVRDIADAADRIAGAAASARSISITEADLAPFTWVRIDSRSSVETLLVPLEQESTCQAAYTSH